MAQQLGETPEVFRWSTFQALPFWLRRTLLVPHPRLCFACLAAGYHAALFSINLLEVCPIHGMPLVERCRCGAPFSATLHSLSDYGSAGSCRCGQLHFFTRETCRRPTLPPEQTAALDPVAAWLDGMSRLIRPRRLEIACHQQMPGTIEWLVTGSRALGLAYPACFRPVAAPPTPVSVVSYGSRYMQTQVRQAPLDPTVRQVDSTADWQTTTTVYRALARRTRRHLAPDSARTVARFVKVCDPLAIGERLRCSGHARQAFVDLLWSRAIEPNVELRRWPDRGLPANATSNLSRLVELDCHICGADWTDHWTKEWLAYHAAGVSLGAIRRDAQAQATAAAHSGIAEWGDGTISTSWSDSVWLAREMTNGVAFLSPLIPAWAGSQNFDKPLRQTMYTQRQRARFEAIWTTSRGPCLTWSETDGWEVLDAFTPADHDLRHCRLLGFEAGRPRCWLYRTGDGRFAAHWDNARLQVLGTTPAAAISGLRRCATTYQHICGVELPFPASGPIIRPKPMAAQLAAEYELFVDCVKARDGFWREAKALSEAACWYREALAWADQVRREREGNHQPGTTTAG